MIRVLLVDDQPLIRSGFRALLELEDDIEVVAEAADGNEGLALAKAHLPDLVLIDIQMPGVDGLEATRRLRADPRTASIPIIAVTASVMERDRHQTLEAGCDGHIAKPIDPSTFGQQIAAYIKD